MKERVLEFFGDLIKMYRSMGFTMTEIADFLYKTNQISYVERDLIRGEDKDETTRSK